MAENDTLFPKGDNGGFSTGLSDFFFCRAEPSAFTGGTENTRGGVGETSDPLTLFTVTGDVLVGVFGVCTTNLTSGGGGSLSLGLTDNTTLFIGSTTATTIDANEVWMDTTPAIGKSIDALNYYVVGNGEDIIEDTISADITAGQIYYIALWKPLSLESKIVAADTN